MIFDEKFFPYDLYLEEERDFDTLINNMNNFYHWCASRVLSLDRKYAKACQRIDKKTYYGMNILDYLVGNIEKILLNKKLRDYPKSGGHGAFSIYYSCRLLSR